MCPKKGVISKAISHLRTPLDNVVASCPIQPTIDAHWKKQYKVTAHEYIARWWHDAYILFNSACSPYFQPMWDSVVAVGKGFKGPSMHDLRGSFLEKEIKSLGEYVKEFKESWAITECTIMSNGWTCYHRSYCCLDRVILFRMGEGTGNQSRDLPKP